MSRKIIYVTAMKQLYKFPIDSVYSLNAFPLSHCLHDKNILLYQRDERLKIRKALLVSLREKCGSLLSEWLIFLTSTCTKTPAPLTLACKRKWDHFFGGNIKFLRYAYVKLRLPPPYAIKYYVPHDSRSLSITHAMVMVIIRVM